MTKRNDISYLAGIIDGEGCISITHNKKRKSYRLRISITSTDKILLDWVQERYGGYTYERKKQLPHHKRKYEWSLFPNCQQKIFLELLADTLLIKKDRALLGLELIKLSGQRGDEVREKREKIRLSLSWLNQGGARD